MDLSTMMSKIDLHKYETVKEFISDLDQICKNALEYNPDTDAPGMSHVVALICEKLNVILL